MQPLRGWCKFRPVNDRRKSLMGSLSERLNALPRATLAAMRRGVEKESLRTQADGALAMTPHPAALGSALTHPHITTDFSESQLELITRAHKGIDACVAELTQVHQVVYRHIGDEMLWVGSMPCGLPTDENIPIGRYGSSNVGRAKSVYRVGLGHRYGRRMQTISGIHYNWSLPGLSSDALFALIRNFRRQSFLLLLLFGASPSVCSSFVAGREHQLLTLKGHTLYLPHATSLRMGRLGYQSDAQATLAVSYNSLDSYAASLQEALTKPYPAYEAVGIRNPGGDYNQLSTSLLQIENENYGVIRPKRVIFPGERPLHALRERGVEYVEVRCMDLDPFVPVGIEAATMRFIDLFLLHCLLEPSAPDTPDELAALRHNQQLAAERGREPGLKLQRGHAEVSLLDWGVQIVEQCRPLAEAMDAVLGGRAYRDALRMAMAGLANTDTLPSARILATMRRDFDSSYTAFVRAQSQQARNVLLGLPWSDEQEQRFAAMAIESIAAQQRIEAADTMPFETYRQQYLSPERLGT
jgi:glutamate--cysteine ligase